jgi:hypothetical protein
MGPKRNAYRILGKPEGKKPLGKPRLGGWIILKWVLDGMGGMYWGNLAQDKDQWEALMMNLRVP